MKYSVTVYPFGTPNKSGVPHIAVHANYRTAQERINNRLAVAQTMLDFASLYDDQEQRQYFKEPTGKLHPLDDRIYKTAELIDLLREKCFAKPQDLNYRDNQKLWDESWLNPDQPQNHIYDCHVTRHNWMVKEFLKNLGNKGFIEADIKFLENRFLIEYVELDPTKPLNPHTQFDDEIHKYTPKHNRTCESWQKLFEDDSVVLFKK